MRYVLLATLFAGCTGFGDFAITVSIAEQRIPGGAPPTLVDVPLDVNLEQEIAARDTGPAQHARLDTLSFSITPTAEAAGDTDDFAFVDHVEVFIESAREGSTLTRLKVAEHDAGQPGDRTLEFVTDATLDLLPYLQEGARLTSGTEGRIPPDDVTFDGSAVLSLEVL